MQINPRPAVNLLLDAAANRQSSAAAPSAGVFGNAGASATLAARGDSLFLAIGGELQRIDQSRQLLRQVKGDIETLRAQLASPDDESATTDDAAAALRSTIAGIQLGLSDLATLHPPPAADAWEEDPVKKIGTIINGLDPESLAEPTSADATADALAQIDSALAAANALEQTLNSERQRAALPRALAALAPQSDADALVLAKAIADSLRSTTDALGSRNLLSTTV